MSTSLQHDTTWQAGQEVSDVRWAIGNRTSRLADYLLKLGDRLCGDYPKGVEEVFRLGYAMGKRKPGETIDLEQVYKL